MYHIFSRQIYPAFLKKYLIIQQKIEHKNKLMTLMTAQFFTLKIFNHFEDFNSYNNLNRTKIKIPTHN